MGYFRRREGFDGCASKGRGKLKRGIELGCYIEQQCGLLEEETLVAVKRGEYLLVGVSSEQALSMMWSTGSMSSYLSWLFEREQQQLPVQDGLQQMP
ncbi:unnamed protein product [Sphagnum jensenii]|uniref:Uncharacterized protein n=1 Tax=Sphagnum jensenii TaxID=128206 RepID=A0ABP1BCT2_9BRYO